jgi:uncharacterized protein
MADFTPTPRTQVHRIPQRASYDRAVVFSILDEALVCHVGFQIDGQPFVIPTTYARVDDRLYVHGAAASRMLKSLAGGLPLCLTVTLLDGLVLARSAFHHSMNYRSVVILGRATEVTDPETKRMALDAIVDHMLPGRSREARPGNAKEVAATRVLELPLSEVSAKVRTGGPLDDAEDMNVECWAGHVPIALTAAPPIADTQLREGITLPDRIARYVR